MMPFWIALQFLTVCPVQLKQMPTQQQNANALLFYPLIGLLIGSMLCGIVLLLHALPAVLLSVICLVLWIWLTGGLHLDGLADTADAWIGGLGDKDRTLSIMKDPSCGPIGVLSLIMLCMLKWSCLYVLIEQDLLWYLLFVPMLGRLAPLYLFLTTPYVRSQGLGAAIATQLPRQWARLMLVLGALLPFVLGLSAILSVLLAGLMLLYLRAKFLQRLDGITGDTIGASIEIIEALSLLGVVIFSFYL